MIGTTDSSEDSRVYIFFPVYNEGPDAGSLVRRIHRSCSQLGERCQVLVVDDGSTDDSVPNILDAAGQVSLQLFKHSSNLGLAPALRTGIDYLLERIEPGDAVFFMDGDDTHDPRFIPEMLELLESGAEVVVASRFCKGAKTGWVPQHRRLLSFGANLVGRILFPIPGIRDYACGFRGIRGETLTALSERYRGALLELDRYGFVCSVELLVKLSEVADRFVEIPLELRYDRKSSPSKMRVGRTVLGYFALFMQRRRARKSRSSAPSSPE